MNDKLQGGDIQVENRFVRWFKNYWYYYKWPVIVAAFALIVVLICTLQMCSKDNADVSVVYAGSYNFVGEGTGKLEAAFSGLMPEDYNGDGKKSVAVASLMIYSEEQLEEMKAAADEAGEDYVVNAVYFAQEKQKFNQLLMSGEYTICLIEEWLYEETRETGIFLPLADALGEVPEGAYDDCAIRLGNTGFGQYFTAAQALPEETLICFRQQGSLGTLLNKDKAQADYDHALETFRAVMAFSAE